MLVQRIEDLDDLLAPVEERFGENKREQVACVLLLGAQLAMKQELMRKTKDPELRAELAVQIPEMRQGLKLLRHEVGMYVMSYVRSIMPRTTWSLWARLEQILTRLETPRTNLWNAVGTKHAVHDSTGMGLHARIQAEFDARMRPQRGQRMARNSYSKRRKGLRKGERIGGRTAPYSWRIER
jgi:hypothetical protein